MKTVTKVELRKIIMVFDVGGETIHAAIQRTGGEYPWTVGFRHVTEATPRFEAFAVQYGGMRGLVFASERNIRNIMKTELATKGWVI